MHSRVLNEYLQEHSLAIEDNVEHLFGGNIELPTPCYPSAGGVLLFQIRSAGRLTARAGERPLLSC